MQTEQSAKFQKIFQAEANTHCFQCGESSRQWAELVHAVLLCPKCATVFRQFSWVTNVKSLNWDDWTLLEIYRLQQGGNEKFSQFLKKYHLQSADPRTKVTCKASRCYRRLLEGKNQQQLGLEQGRMIDRQNIPLSEMLPEEIIESAKEKTVWLGDKTKEGIRIVQDKWESGQIKEGALEVAESIGTKAQSIWSTFTAKITELTANSDAI